MELPERQRDLGLGALLPQLHALAQDVVGDLGMPREDLGRLREGVADVPQDAVVEGTPGDLGQPARAADDPRAVARVQRDHAVERAAAEVIDHGSPVYRAEAGQCRHRFGFQPDPGRVVPGGDAGGHGQVPDPRLPRDWHGHQHEVRLNRHLG